MLIDEICKKSKEIIGPYLDSLGFELVDLRIFRAQGLFNLRLLADKPRGGISIDECANLNKRVGELLDKEDIFKEAYILEISSPGMDRSLITGNDFLKVCGRAVRVFLKEPLNLKIELEGVVEAVEGEFLFLRTKSKTEKVPLSIINKGKQII